MLSIGIFSLGVSLLQRLKTERIDWLLAGCPFHWSTSCVSVHVWHSLRYNWHREYLCSPLGLNVYICTQFLGIYLLWREQKVHLCPANQYSHGRKTQYVLRNIITTNHDYLLNRISYSTARHTHEDRDLHRGLRESMAVHPEVQIKLPANLPLQFVIYNLLKTLTICPHTTGISICRHNNSAHTNPYIQPWKDDCVSLACSACTAQLPSFMEKSSFLIYTATLKFSGHHPKEPYVETQMSKSVRSCPLCVIYLIELRIEHTIARLKAYEMGLFVFNSDNPQFAGD